MCACESPCVTPTPYCPPHRQPHRSSPRWVIRDARPDVAAISEGSRMEDPSRTQPTEKQQPRCSRSGPVSRLSGKDAIAVHEPFPLAKRLRIAPSHPSRERIRSAHRSGLGVCTRVTRRPPPEANETALPERKEGHKAKGTRTTAGNRRRQRAAETRRERRNQGGTATATAGPEGHGRTGREMHLRTTATLATPTARQQLASCPRSHTAPSLWRSGREWSTLLRTADR